MTLQVTRRDARILLGGAAVLLAFGLLVSSFGWSILGMLPRLKEQSTQLQTQQGQGGGTVESPLAANGAQIIVQLQVLSVAMIVLGAVSIAAALSLALLFGGKAFSRPGTH